MKNTQMYVFKFSMEVMPQCYTGETKFEMTAHLE